MYVVNALAGHQIMHQYRMRYTKRIKKKEKIRYRLLLAIEQKWYQRSHYLFKNHNETHRLAEDSDLLAEEVGAPNLVSQK